MNTPQLNKYALCALVTLATTTVHGQAINFTSDADTYVRRGHINPPTDGDANYGSATTFGALNDVGVSKEKDRIALLRFNIGEQLIQYTGVTLSLTLASGTSHGAFQLFGIPDLGPDELFNENTITFNTFHYGTTSVSGSLDTSELTLLGTFDTAVSTTISTSELTDFINADTNGYVSFVLFRTSESGNATNFVSKEGNIDLAPTLSLNPIPEPATMTLLFAATSLLAAAYRRRRQQRS